MDLYTLKPIEFKLAFVLADTADDAGRVQLNKSEIARRVGIGRTSLYSALRTLGQMGIWDDEKSVFNSEMCSFSEQVSVHEANRCSLNEQVSAHEANRCSLNEHIGPQTPNVRANITAFTNVKASSCTNNNNNGVDDVEENVGKDDPIIQENDIAAPIDTNDLIADLDDEERESFAEMLDIWADLDPQARCLDPGPWFKKLIRAYGHKIAAGGLLRLQITNFWIEGLENPKAYARYIVKVLDGIKENGLPPLGESPPVNGGVTSAANNPYKSNKNDPHYDKWSDPAQFVGLPASSITAECAE
jgi:transposase-like protein